MDNFYTKWSKETFKSLFFLSITNGSGLLIGSLKAVRYLYNYCILVDTSYFLRE